MSLSGLSAGLLLSQLYTSIRRALALKQEKHCVEVAEGEGGQEWRNGKDPSVHFVLQGGGGGKLPLIECGSAFWNVPWAHLVTTKCKAKCGSHTPTSSSASPLAESGPCDSPAEHPWENVELIQQELDPLGRDTADRRVLAKEKHFNTAQDFLGQAGVEGGLPARLQHRNAALLPVNSPSQHMGAGRHFAKAGDAKSKVWTSFKNSPLPPHGKLGQLSGSGARNQMLQ